ncbi:MAG: leucine-rich repeat protein, partial [Solobacterium sp.]|nr:leucine-rich repeat protein [Solobacterium sp.]
MKKRKTLIALASMMCISVLPIEINAENVGYSVNADYTLTSEENIYTKKSIEITPELKKDSSKQSAGFCEIAQQFKNNLDNEESVTSNSITELINNLPEITQTTASDYYWYMQLSDVEKAFYWINVNYSEYPSGVKITDLEGYSEDELRDSVFFALSAAKLDHPWLSGTINTCDFSCDLENNSITICHVFHSYSTYIMEKAKARFDQIKNTAGSYDNYICIRNILQFINNHITYDGRTFFGMGDLNGGTSFNIIGGLAWDTAVCSGLSYLFKAVCDELSIPCIIIEGTASVNHAWNAVQMEDGEWYIVDCTFCAKGNPLEMWVVLEPGDTKNQYQNQGILSWNGLFTRYNIPELSEFTYHYNGIYDDSMYVEAENTFIEPEATFLYTVLDDDTCKITGYEGSKDGDLIIPETIDGHTVTVIGEKAFAGISQFTGALILPKTLKRIEEYAFSACYGLTGELVLPEGLQFIGRNAFESCISLGDNKDLVLPSTLETIEIEAFRDCYSFMGTIYIPDKIKDITNVFDYCRNIDSFYISENNEGLCNVNGVVYTKDKKRLIRCPENKTGNIEILDGVEYISNAAFLNCYKLSGDLTLPQSLIDIDDNAFSMTGIKGDLVIPDNVKRIGNHAFSNGTDGFTGESFLGFGGTLTLGDKVEYIGDYAFLSCRFTGELHLPDSLQYLGSWAFSSCGFKGQLVIPDKIEEIQVNTFSCNYFSGSLIIPSSVKTIGEYAFASCDFDGTLTLNQGIEHIDARAFDNNSFIGELILPSSLSEVGEYAFGSNDFNSVICSCGETCVKTLVQEPSYVPLIWGRESFLCPNCNKEYVEKDIRPEGHWTDKIEHKSTEEMQCLELDKTYSLRIDKANYYNYYYFVPEETGLYRFETSTYETESAVSKYCIVYNTDWSEKPGAINRLDNGNIVGEYVLEKGITYYFVFSSEYVTPCTFSLRMMLTDQHQVGYYDIVQPTCEEEGRSDYWMCDWCGKKFKDMSCEEEVSDEELVIPPFGHEYGEAIYEWSEDNSSVTAKAVCEHDASHVITETVKTTVKTVDATCEAAGSTTYTAAFTKELFSEQTKVIEIPATGHKYGEPTYEWASDNSSVTAKAVCEHDESHVISETVKTTVKTVEPTCETAGSTTYTATFTNELFSEQTKAVEIPALDHKYGEPTYEWASDNSSVTAKAVCEHDANHVITETVKTTVKTIDATCETAGSTTYTATFTNELFSEQSKVVEIPALGHKYGEPTYEWSSDNSSVTAKAVCEHDASHVITETVKTTVKTVDATCEAAGSTTYTATFKNELFSEQTKVVEIPALGHDWQNPVWTWAEDYSKASVTFTCAHDASHTKTIEAEITKETDAASCEEPGLVTYTAKAVLEGTEYTDSKEVYVEAVGHAWGEPLYEWSADNRSVTATAVCKNDASHKVTETVQTIVKTVDATCEEAGSTTYTATFTNELFSEQTKTVEIPALGHKYGEPTYEWSADNSSVTAKAICEHDAD